MRVPPTDLELLGIQAEGSFDEAGRLIGQYGVTIACAPDSQALWIGADVQDTISAELRSLFDGAAPAGDPAEPPPALRLCRRLLETGGRSLRCKAGPSFVFPEETAFTSEARIERSDGPDPAALSNANPGNWHPIEWNELLEGRLGPWTMAVDRGLVLSICHTPRPFTALRAECGVWTHPGFRGRGHGAAVTAEWAALMRSSGRHLFYSTDADNFSSQRLTQRLGLRPIGWVWRLSTVPDRPDDGLHPLCSLYRHR